MSTYETEIHAKRNYYMSIKVNEEKRISQIPWKDKFRGMVNSDIMN